MVLFFRPPGAHSERFMMMRLLMGILILLMFSVPVGVSAFSPPRSQGQGHALLLSSLNETLPMGNYAKNTIFYLRHAGYNVTYLTDGAVTVDFLLNQLTNYSVVIWRSDTYNWHHTTYWYVGEKSNDGVQSKYASNFTAGWMNTNAGIVGVSAAFFSYYFHPSSLQGVGIMMFISSQGVDVAPMLHRAGATAVIFCNGYTPLQLGLIDELTVQIVSYLTQGESVYNAVYDTISPYSQGEQVADTTYAPPFWFIGDASLTISAGIVHAKGH